MPIAHFNDLVKQLATVRGTFTMFILISCGWFNSLTAKVYILIWYLLQHMIKNRRWKDQENWPHFRCITNGADLSRFSNHVCILSTVSVKQKKISKCYWFLKKRNLIAWAALKFSPVEGAISHRNVHLGAQMKNGFPEHGALQEIYERLKQKNRPKLDVNCGWNWWRLHYRGVQKPMPEADTGLYWKIWAARL